MIMVGACKMINFRKFLKNVLPLLNIDKILNTKEFKYALDNIHNTDELNGFLEVLAEKKKRSEKPCPNCQTELRDVLKEGKLGCNQCASHFSEFIMSQLGKDSSSDILRLQMKMNTAVAMEQYEKAAVIRDKIKKLLRK